MLAIIGESLGENNMYLHGAPELIAPKEQKRSPYASVAVKRF